MAKRRAEESLEIIDNSGSEAIPNFELDTAQDRQEAADAIMEAQSDLLKKGEPRGASALPDADDLVGLTSEQLKVEGIGEMTLQSSETALGAILPEPVVEIPEEKGEKWRPVHGFSGSVPATCDRLSDGIGPVTIRDLEYLVGETLAKHVERQALGVNNHWANYLAQQTWYALEVGGFDVPLGGIEDHDIEERDAARDENPLQKENALIRRLVGLDCYERINVRCIELNVSTRSGFRAGLALMVLRGLI